MPFLPGAAKVPVLRCPCTPRLPGPRVSGSICHRLPPPEIETRLVERSRFTPNAALGEGGGLLSERRPRGSPAQAAGAGRGQAGRAPGAGESRAPTRHSAARGLRQNWVNEGREAFREGARQSHSTHRKRRLRGGAGRGLADWTDGAGAGLLAPRVPLLHVHAPAVPLRGAPLPHSTQPSPGLLSRRGLVAQPPKLPRAWCLTGGGGRTSFESFRETLGGRRQAQPGSK